jgi:hypothetical protein
MFETWDLILYLGFGELAISTTPADQSEWLEGIG